MERSSTDEAESRRSKREATNVDNEENRASKLFGSIHFNKKGSILKRMSFKGHMADSGVDVDEEMERDGNEEDNDADFDCFEQGEEDDDEEEYVDAVQAEDNEAAELLANRMDSPIDDSDDDFFDSDEETDDEEVEAALKAMSTVTTAKQAIGGSYGVGSEFQSAAREFAAVQRANRKKEEMKQQEIYNESGGQSPLGDIGRGLNLKRGRAELGDYNEDDKSRQNFENEYKKTKLEDELMVTEENIKAYINQQGGKVKASEMYKPFKRMMKEQHGENHKKVFKSFIDRICKKIEDPTMGVVFMLRVNPKLAALPSTSNT